MPHPDTEKWDAIYRSGGHQQQGPSGVLRNYAHLLPAIGKALEPACGRGSNALFLAQSGLETSAWDISREAIQYLQQNAEKLGLQISTSVRDVVANPPPESSFDVIVVSYFLERQLFPCLISALKPDGLLFYQTFTRTCVENTGPRNEAYRLGDNELLQCCNELHILAYHEEGLAGNIKQGFRNEAMLIGQRR